MRVVFADQALRDLCCCHRRMVTEWGAAAGDVELALCTLGACDDLHSFVALPVVTQEDHHLIFAGHQSTVRMTVRQFESDGDTSHVLIRALELGDDGGKNT